MRHLKSCATASNLLSGCIVLTQPAELAWHAIEWLRILIGSTIEIGYALQDEI